MICRRDASCRGFVAVPFQVMGKFSMYCLEIGTPLNMRRTTSRQFEDEDEDEDENDYEQSGCCRHFAADIVVPVNDACADE
jgi:hypothetical protein